MKIAGTGHRPDKLCGYRTPNVMSDCVGALLRQYLQRERPEEVITGMALGFDQWLAWMCIELNIPFAAYLPCDNFDSRWPDQSREQYRHLLSRAARVVECSPREPYSPRLMQVRNVRMVNDSDKVVALWNGTPGGTQNCIRYAKSIFRTIDYLPVPVEIWDQARAWEEQNVRRNRPPPAPVWGRPAHLQRRRRSNIVDQLIQEQRANQNNDVLPDVRVEVRTVEPVSRRFDPSRGVALAPPPGVEGERIQGILERDLREARSQEDRSRALARYHQRRERILARTADPNPTTRLPRLTDEFPLPTPPAIPAEAPPAERARRQAEMLQQFTDTDVLRALVEQNRHLLTPEAPEPKILNTDNEDRFTPRRKIDLDE